MTCTGRVIEEQKNYYVVATASGITHATASGSQRKRKTRICTGDIVDLKIIDTDPPRGIIHRIHPRTAYIRRPPLANCSHLFCVVTLKEPPLNMEILDRLLFSGLVHGLTPCIVFNKTDLFSQADSDECEHIGKTYRDIGITTVNVSAHAKTGIAALTELCRNRIGAFAGLSGVGKTSLLSCIFPEHEFRIGDLSAAATRGTHTTTHTTLLPLENGGYIADTPGISFVDIPQVPPEDVAHYFNEISECTGLCRFNNCRHRNEPDCCVREKVDTGHIALWRYTHYLRFYEEMLAFERKFPNRLKTN